MATLAEAFVRAALPACCALCTRALPWRGSAAGVCGSCWSSVREHTAACPRCGDPETIAGEPCLACREEEPPWRAAVAVGPYDGTLRELVLLCKQGRRDELARPLAHRLAAAFRRSGWPEVALFVPVPMWWGRRLRRGFNQAELLSREVARQLGGRSVAALSRRRGRPQVGRSRSERRRLSGSAFTARRPVAGDVVLVDDVLTTGATAAACTRALLAAGADAVYLLTVARTPRPGRIP